MQEPRDQADAELLRDALLTIRKQRAQLKAQEAARSEPIAIVGIGCRIPPAVEDASTFWRSQTTTHSAAAPMPRDRFWFGDFLHESGARPPGIPLARRGMFLEDVLSFDPAVFGIARAEAESMDPQHRVLLEVTWHALEDAGLPPHRLSSVVTGVFVGLMNHDYGHIVCRDLGGVRAHTAAGNGLGVAAGRLSHALGFSGPSIAIDTNCSSSLVAVHLAAASLRLGECDVAVVAGANLILSPIMNVVMAKAGALSPEDRCKSFDRRADGYARGEGAAAVVLKRLSDARGDRVYASIRGTAINHAGRTTALSVPSQRAQSEVMRRALQVAGLEPESVEYVEAHGTGTPLGDPIELESIHAAYRAGSGAPLYVGTAKSSIGHLEGAAGIVSLVRAALALHHRTLPGAGGDFSRTRHFDWSAAPLEIVTASRTWPRGAGARRAGVSAFGFSGTNCHVVLEEAPEGAAAPPAAPELPLLLCVSAATPRSLTALVARYRDRLGDVGPTEALAVCGWARTGRASLGHRVAVVARTPAELRDRLSRAEQHAPRRSETVRLHAAVGADLAWYRVYGAALYPAYEDFRADVARLDSAMSGRGCSASAFLQGADASPDSRQAALLQMVLAIAILRLLARWGLEVGQASAGPVGRLAVAAVAGVVSPDVAADLVEALPDVAAGSAATAPDSRAVLHAAASRARTASATIDLYADGGYLPWDRLFDTTFWDSTASSDPCPAGDALWLPLGMPTPSRATPDGAVASLLQTRDPLLHLFEALRDVYLAGGNVRWSAVAPAHPFAAVPLYPFDRTPLAVAGTACDPLRPARTSSGPPPARSEDHAPSADASPQGVRAVVLQELEALIPERAPFDIDTPLADLGLDSLLAMELTSRLAAVYDSRVSGELLLRAEDLGGYVREVARVVAGGDSADGRPCLPVRLHASSRASKTLVLVHAVGGTVQPYAPLARLLGDDAAVLALASPLHDVAQPSLLELAESYVVEMKREMPEGPYWLGGWSFGGVVSLEMARLLRSRGDDVRLVALLDALVFDRAHAAQDDEADRLALAVFALEIGLEERDLAAHASGSASERLAALWRIAQSRGLAPAALPVEAIAARYRVLRRNLTALLGYAPRPYDGDVVYAKAADASAGRPIGLSHLDRRFLPATIDERTVPSTHFTLLHPAHVGVVAEMLRRALRHGGGRRQIASSLEVSG